tara:strand:+ start:755 stop:1039 length:285 start_codon:yes stop_codon:yes gene_type:complete
MSKKSDLPFEENQISESSFIRKFSVETNDDEFVWHRDREDRIIKIIGGEGWLIQLDNRLPIELSQGREIFIKKGEWHRVIKGSSDLILKIKKMK